MWQTTTCTSPTQRQRDYAESLLDKLQDAGEDIYNLQRQYAHCKSINEMSVLIEKLKGLWEDTKDGDPGSTWW
jgi:hypothetical protein